MAAVATHLADTSVLGRLHHPEVAALIVPLIEAGLVATCAMVDFEVLWSTRSPDDFDRVRSDRSLGYEWLPIDDADLIRALDVQQQLWRNGAMRTVPFPDLVVAAVAERHHVTVVHYDADYDKIAAITGQATQWVALRGSLA